MFLIFNSITIANFKLRIYHELIKKIGHDFFCISTFFNQNKQARLGRTKRAVFVKYFCELASQEGKIPNQAHVK